MEFITEVSGDGQVVLAGHNAKKFDVRVLQSQLRLYGLDLGQQEFVYGFGDSMDVVRIFKNQIGLLNLNNCLRYVMYYYHLFQNIFLRTMLLCTSLE